MYVYGQTFIFFLTTRDNIGDCNSLYLDVFVPKHKSKGDGGSGGLEGIFRNYRNNLWIIFYYLYKISLLLLRVDAFHMSAPVFNF